MINTVISKINDSLIVHSVGLNNCLEITENKHESNSEFELYSYEAVYPNEVKQIQDVILATDKSLV